MEDKITSVMIKGVLNGTYTYLESKYEGQDLRMLKEKLLALSGIKSFDFSSVEGKNYSYGDIQEMLAALNEKEFIRKSKGVYYTPADVVKFILENSIKSVYGKLRTSSLNVMDWNGIPYRSFCTAKLVLDPTCGTGEFVLAAFEAKLDLLDNHVDNVTEGLLEKTIATIFGNDINKESTLITKIRLFLCALRRYGLKKCSSIDVILNKNFTNIDFVSTMPDFGRTFDLIIGNPPYVEDSKSDLELTRKYGNIYANVLKNSAELLSANGAMGFVIPLSYVSTPRMGAIRDELLGIAPEQYVLSYADRPDCLFKSVHQKLCILIGKKRNSGRCVYTGNYQYWYKEEREKLFEQTAAVKNNYAGEYYIPKLGTHFDVEVYKKVCRTRNRSSLLDMAGAGGYSVYVNMRAAFWIKAFRQYHSGSEYKRFNFPDSGKADYFSCLINSSLFWWYWICISDCWHITNKELQGFMAPVVTDYAAAMRLAEALENKLEETKRYVGTKQTEYEYKHKECVDVIHQIDDYINALYGLTDEENLYIKNFAYRYRISGGVNSGRD